MTRIIQGVYLKDRKKQTDHIAMTKMMSQLMNGQKVIGGGTVKLRKSSPHGPHAQPERDLRNSIIDYLEMYGIKVYWVENRAFMNRANRRRRVGFPDLFVFAKRANWSGFMELKADKKDIPTEGPQWEFAQLCHEMGINHLFVTSRDEVEFLVEVV